MKETREGTNIHLSCSKPLELKYPVYPEITFHSLERRHIMRQEIITSIIGILLTFSLTVSLTAQEQSQQGGQKYKNRYTKDLFEDADSNQDGFVDWNEAR